MTDDDIPRFRLLERVGPAAGAAPGEHRGRSVMAAAPCDDPSGRTHEQPEQRRHGDPQPDQPVVVVHQDRRAEEERIVELFAPTIPGPRREAPVRWKRSS